VSETVKAMGRWRAAFHQKANKPGVVIAAYTVNCSIPFLGDEAADERTTDVHKKSRPELPANF